MRFKKLICIGLSLVMIASAAGCGGATGAASAVSEPAAAAEPAATEAAEPAATEAAEPAGTDAAEPAGTDAAEPVATGAAAEEVAPEDISVTWEDSRVYLELSLGRYSTVTTYGVKGYEDVPFLKVTDYLNILFGGRQRTAIENGVMTVINNGAAAVIDPLADTLHFDNATKFRSAGVIDGAIIDDSEYNVISPSTKNASSQTAVTPVTISLSEYHMPVISYEDDILMPFLALQNTFGVLTMSSVLAYNGKDYFNVFEADMFALEPGNEAAADSPYMKAIYAGPFSEKTVTTQAYADYGYYATCLILDLTFGHKEEKNITTFDEYFTRMNAKESMRSTNPASAELAETMLFDYLFDSGHDAIFTVNTVFGQLDLNNSEEAGSIADDIKNSEEGKELFEQEENSVQSGETESMDVIMGALFEKGFKIPEVLSLYAWSMFFEGKRPKDYGHTRLDYAGDTAVIFFDGFKDNTSSRTPSYYLDPIREEDSAASSFAFFYNCFEEIRQHDEVKNVVINLSDNGGGAAAGLVSILGFLSEDGEAKITLLDMVTGSYKEEYYHVDTNLDGIADDQDGFGGQYDFYIMCSGSSYSCGNALPYFAQKNGLAKIIGAKPGGGDCVLGSFVDAYGRCAAYSGMLKLGTDDGSGFVSDEKAVELDLDMMPSIMDIQYVPWLDPEGIADAVHQYQNGATELDYSEREAEDLAAVMQRLFERLAEITGEDAGVGSTSTQQ